jgi:DNA repair photolyase/uncharacterized tellurite resistance protein B-like protein
MDSREIQARSILTETGGFLYAYSHTLQPYRGCTFGKSFCGAACYAPEMRFATPKASWGTCLEIKMNAHEVYRTDYRAWRRRHDPLVIFMSSVTDPYVPQERRYRITRRLLQEMVTHPPDALVLQTHTPNPLWDAETLVAVAAKARVIVQISVETDRDQIPGFPRHAYSIEARLRALGELTALGLTTVGVVSPLMPMDDPEGFARRLGAVADSVIVDHYLVGDGSKNGARTRKRKAHLDHTVPDLLIQAGFEEWTQLEKFHEIVERFRAVLGSDRVGVSRDGFNRLVDDLGACRAPRDCGTVPASMSLLKRIGLAKSDPPPRQRYLAAVREQIDRLPPERAEFVAAFAGLLVRVAHADLEISDAERTVLHDVIAQQAALTAEESAAVADVVVTQATKLAGIDYSSLTAAFNKLGSHDDKEHLVDCLYSIATADGCVTVVEDEEIRQVATTLLLSHKEFIAIRSRYKEQLEVIKALREAQGKRRG